MNVEQREILATIIDRIDNADRSSLLDYLHEVHCRIDDREIACCVLTLLYHNSTDRPLTDACCDDGEHIEIMLNECYHRLGGN